jgi:hypothetical protein
VFLRSLENKRLPAFLTAAFFLLFQASLLLTPSRLTFPDISPEVSSYALVLDMSSDSAYTTPTQSRPRLRSAGYFANDAEAWISVWDEGGTLLAHSKKDGHRLAEYGGLAGSQHFSMVARK